MFDSERARKAGKRGGKRRLVTISPRRRKQIAKAAAAARWAKTPRIDGAK